MDEWILFSLIIGGLIVVIGLIVSIILFRRKEVSEDKEINYKVFYFVGLIWLPVGVVFMTSINFVMGIVFMVLAISYIAIGLANRDKWINKK